MMMEKEKGVVRVVEHMSYLLQNQAEEAVFNLAVDDEEVEDQTEVSSITDFPFRPVVFDFLILHPLP